MTDNMKKFLEELSKNGEFQGRLIKATKDYFQAVNDAAKEQEISITDEDIALLLNACKNHDGGVSDEELASFTAERLAMMDNKTNTMVLDNTELEQVNGGGFCILIGFGFDANACCGSGASVRDDLDNDLDEDNMEHTSEGFGSMACLIMGVGGGFTL